MAHVVIPVPLSIDTTNEIPLANLVPTKGRRRLRILNRKLVSNPVSKSSPPTANPSILGVWVPQTWQKRRQAEAYLASALAASKKTRASARTLPTTPDIVISNDDVVLSRVRHGKHIASKSSCSKTKPTLKAMKYSFSTPSSKSIPKVRSSRNSVSTSKRKQSNSSTSFAQLDRIIHFRQQSVLRGRVVTGFGGPQMVVLLSKLEAQGWSAPFLQGDTQRKMAKREVTEFCINVKSDGRSFTSTMRNTLIHLVPVDVARILEIPSTRWSHYVKLEWPPLPDKSSTLSICRKFSSKHNLTHHRCIEKNEMSPLHKLYCDVVHKIILQRKQRSMLANFLDLTLMELLDTEVLIDLPSLIISHMHRVLNQNKNRHALPYGFWMASIFEAFDVPVQVWVSQTVKDVVGRVNHMALPISMRRLDSPLQRLKDQLAEKEHELPVVNTQF
ncbi:hypothetical protein KY290_010802 [Solanum tuberosum]|uniref:Uncharacterized protein n=1 Tax=Solanum tuberosum TaxID=4113 RepID=A0ABQ7VYU8_SOLTU|nr:hypothetical protein KY290_010802 [Solanum tuberosum]